MAEPLNDYEKLRRAERALGERLEFVVHPVEEDEQVAAAAEDEAPAAELTLDWRQKRAVGWQSPIAPTDAAQTVTLRTVAIEADGTVWWRQTRPADGESSLVRRDPHGEAIDLPVANPVEAVPVPGGGVAVGTLDGRLQLLPAGYGPLPLTAENAEPFSERYTDLVLGPGGQEIWCVRESCNAAGTEWSLVAVPLDGSRTVRTLVSRTRPLASPRPSPDGTLLAWIEWDRPDMPWDGSGLRVGRLTTQGVTGARTLLGGAVESVCQPEWASPTSLYVVSDRTRWWNLYEVGLDGGLRPLCLSAEEFGWPQYAPGLSTYGLLADGRLALLHGCGDWRLDLLDPEDGTLLPLDLPYTAWQPTLRTGGSTIAGVAGSPTIVASVIAVDAASGNCRVLRRSVEEVAEAYVPECRPATFAASDGHDVHVDVYRPRNPEHSAAPGGRVPYLLFLPDGPGAQATRMLDPIKALFTSRGFGVASVDVRGSSGYGRNYREQVYGRWGVVDVEDCAVAARGLVERWGADPDRLIVRGRGAGATLALEALANTDLFAAATVYAPITDLTGLPAATTAGHLRAVAADAASPRTPAWLDRIRRPVLMLHGDRDTAVPVEQTTQLRDALRRHGIPHTCLILPDEGHTLLRAETISRALEAELSFYAGALGDRPGGYAER
jgi:dipeptidyl aminopeptidase/acylaminoacyl peptidase